MVIQLRQNLRRKDTIINFLQTVVFFSTVCIIAPICAYSQTITLIDSITKQRVENAFLRVGNFRFISDSLGKVVFNKHFNNDSIEIKLLGYNNLLFNFPKTDTTVLLIQNIIHLGEFIIKPKEETNTIVGNYKKKSNNVFVNTISDKDVGLTVVNQYKLYNSKIESLLFYVSKDENYNKNSDMAEMEIVFFSKADNGLISNTPFYTLPIKSYSIGWNKVFLNNLNSNKYSDGIIFYGLRWVYNPYKYHYKNITKKKVYNFYGPKLGTLDRSTNDLNHHETLIFQNEKGWRKPINKLNIMIALEITK